MKRRFAAVLIAVISLLTSCGKNNLRSDITKFIASFSITNAVENYPKGSYERVDISEENGSIFKVVTTLKMNRENAENLVYDSLKISYENDVQTTCIHHFVERKEDKYFYLDGVSEVEKSSEEVISLTNEFFYTSSTEGIYTGGMFMGDAFREILPNIQDNVTIDSENKLLVYSYVNHMKEKNKEVTITQTMVIDEYGMLVKDDMVKVSEQGKFETHIVVTK